ncbi:hypothetical protein OHV05_26925 [Kitasatospora sp. NBC_00070]|uniref:hypothetical protein n=1 Tax=Kitasatospora sp. NBC_00070 TaxID=2975962 RepID=UPI0032541EAF
MTNVGPEQPSPHDGPLPEADAATVAEPRYEALQLPPDSWGREPWAVLDHHAGRWVEAGVEVDLYATRDSARSCIRRLHYLDQAGIRWH